MNRNLYIVLIASVLPLSGFSQPGRADSKPPNALGIGFDAGITSFFGDIDEGAAKGDIMNNLAFRGSVCKNFGYWFILEAQILTGNLSGEKKRGTEEVSNYQYFKSNFVEYSLNADINLISMFGKNKNPRFNLCVDVGAGVFTFKSKLYNGNTDDEIASYGYDGNTLSKLVIPVGVKIGYNISEHFYVLAQTSTRIVDSDLLDAKEGNNNRDFYNYTSVGFIYKIFFNSSSKGYGQYNRVSGGSIGTACATFN